MAGDTLSQPFSVPVVLLLVERRTAAVAPV